MLRVVLQTRRHKSKGVLALAKEPFSCLAPDVRSLFSFLPHFSSCEECFEALLNRSMTDEAGINVCDGERKRVQEQGLDLIVMGYSQHYILERCIIIVRRRVLLL